MKLPLPLRLLALAAIGYLLLMALMYSFQSRLVHLPHVPGRELTATPQDIGLDYETVSLEAEDGVGLHGWFLPADDARGTLLFFHGNAGNISHRLESLRIFHGLGLNTLIIDYRGYGESEGSPSEAGLYQDGSAAYHHLTEDRGIAPEAIISFGRSLGAAVAARTAAQYPVAGLIVESGFTSVPDLGAEIYPFLPVRQLSRLHYDTQAFVQTTDVPVLVIHSEDDDIIPYHHGQSLYQAAGDRGSFLKIQGDHNTGFMASGNHYRQGLADFLQSVLAK